MKRMTILLALLLAGMLAVAGATPCVYCIPNPFSKMGLVVSSMAPPSPPSVVHTDEAPCNSVVSSTK